MSYQKGKKTVDNQVANIRHVSVRGRPKKNFEKQSQDIDTSSAVAVRQSARAKKRKQIFGEEDIETVPKAKSAVRITKVNKPVAPDGAFGEISGTVAVNILGDPLYTSTQNVQDSEDQDAQGFHCATTDSEDEEPTAKNKCSAESKKRSTFYSSDSDSQEKLDTSNDNSLVIDSNNPSSEDEDHYQREKDEGAHQHQAEGEYDQTNDESVAEVLHQPLKAKHTPKEHQHVKDHRNKPEREDRVSTTKQSSGKESSHKINTFSEKSESTGSSSRSPDLLTPLTVQRKIFEMDIKLDVILQEIKKLALGSPSDFHAKDNGESNSRQSFKLKLPLNTMEELEELERSLQSNKVSVQTFMRDLAFLGVEGQFNKRITNILKHVIGNDLWQHFTFCGIESKAGVTLVRKFKGLDIYQCIENAIRIRFPNETVATINAKCIDVFTKTRSLLKTKSAKNDE